MPRLSCYIVVVTDVDTFHRASCADAERVLGREAGLMDNTSLALAVHDWVNGVIDDKLTPQKIAFCDHCKPQDELLDPIPKCKQCGIDCVVNDQRDWVCNNVTCFSFAS